MTKLLERLLLFIDKHQVTSALIGMALVLIVFSLLYPLFQPVPISEDKGNVVIARPLSVIPGKGYSLTIRATKENVTFDVKEGDPFTTITTVETFTQLSYRRKVIFDVSSPYPLDFQIHHASFVIDVKEKGQSNPVVTYIPIDTVSLPLRLSISFILSAPAVQIFTYLLKRFRK